MLSILRLVVLGVCITTTARIASFDNPLKTPLEVLKATGIAQKQLEYSNDIAHLIRNGNKYAFVTALFLKYGYNPISKTPFELIKMNTVEPDTAIKDFAHYRGTLQEEESKIAAEKELRMEQQKIESPHQGMISDGLIQTGASIAGYMFIPGPLKALAIPCLAYITTTGVKKIFDGIFYQEHLKSRKHNNAFMQNVLNNAASQLGGNVLAKVTEEK